VDWLNDPGAPKKPTSAVVNFLRANTDLATAPNKAQLLARAKKAYIELFQLVPSVEFFDTEAMPEVIDGRVRWTERNVPIGPIKKEAVPIEVWGSVKKLADWGLLGRTRKCPQCGRWFFAKFDHATFDSRKCQQEMLRASPKWRKGRAAYMRRLRRLLKSHPNLKKGGK
jgi:hypothetical protein